MTGSAKYLRIRLVAPIIAIFIVSVSLQAGEMPRFTNVAAASKFVAAEIALIAGASGHRGPSVVSITKPSRADRNAVDEAFRSTAGTGPADTSVSIYWAINSFGETGILRAWLVEPDGLILGSSAATFSDSSNGGTRGGVGYEISRIRGGGFGDQASLSIEITPSKGDSFAYFDGETVVLMASTTGNCRITITHLSSSGEITPLIPDDGGAPLLITAGAPWRIPDDFGFSVHASEPYGLDYFVIRIYPELLDNFASPATRGGLGWEKSQVRGIKDASNAPAPVSGEPLMEFTVPVLILPQIN